MTFTKKLLTTSISVLAIAGMLLMASPAQAGFFDWFNNSPLSQGAAAVKSVSTDYSSDTKSVVESFKFTAQGNVKEVKNESFLKDLFSRTKSTPVVQVPSSRFSDQGTVFNPEKDISYKSAPCPPGYHRLTPNGTCIFGGYEDYNDSIQLNIAPNTGEVSKPKDPNYSSLFDSRIAAGDFDQSVVDLQGWLKRFGYYSGPIDGDYGAGTVGAVKAFQRANGMPATQGKAVGPKTRNALEAQKDKYNAARSGSGDQTPPYVPIEKRSKTEVLQDVFGDNFEGARYEVTCRQNAWPHMTSTGLLDNDPSNGEGTFNIYNAAGQATSSCSVASAS